MQFVRNGPDPPERLLQLHEEDGDHTECCTARLFKPHIDIVALDAGELTSGCAVMRQRRLDLDIPNALIHDHVDG